VIGVVLLNLGGPDSLQAVRPFLYNLFSDRKIIRLGPRFMQRPLAWLISTLKAPRSRKWYGLIGGASPLPEITAAQARALEEKLRGRGNFRVYVGMRYWKPFIGEAVARAERDGVRKLISLTLYPHYSVATTGSSEDALREALAGREMDWAAVSSFHEHPLYIEALAGLIRKELRDETEVLFSAHSLPVSLIEAGDPYVKHITGTIRALEEKLGVRGHLGYQSRTGPVEWLEPSTEEVLKTLAGGGARDVLLVPISFVSDHIETLYEIDILYRGMAEKLGLRARRTESLNTHPLFISALEDLVTAKAREVGWL
jgi:ferrochelatase